MLERFRANRDASDTTARGTTTASRTDLIRDRVIPLDVRGGVSAGAILTGVVVAFGAMFILTALITAILIALGVQEAEVSTNEAFEASIGVGIGFIVAQFLAYMWGGYTAGRMGRGAGMANGLLVALVALVLAVIVGAIIVAVGANVDTNLPFRLNLPFDPNNFGAEANAEEWGIGLSVGVLLAMFIGGAIGGGMGSRWHTKLERGAYDEATGGRDDTIDVRDRRPATTTATERRPVTTGGKTSGTDAPPPPSR